MSYNSHAHIEDLTTLSSVMNTMNRITESLEQAINDLTETNNTLYDLGLYDGAADVERFRMMLVPMRSLLDGKQHDIAEAFHKKQSEELSNS